MRGNPKRIQKTIGRLNLEIEQINQAIYGTEEGEPWLVAAMLERKRDDIVRSAVLQLHTKIEDLLTRIMLFCALDITEKRLKHRVASDRGKAYRRMLYDRESLGFDMKLNWAVGLGLLTPSGREKLMELNNIRNKCSHNWVLNRAVRRGKRPKQLKPPLLRWRGRDLHKVPVIEDFISEFEGVYLRMYARFVQ
ncbi:MAG TPA: hypothetical protein VKW08_00280 [Xanthobacteraceae bacterium]|jgi:hypothetical protein|nr:hypothetical protein [Xanthobacteraceae bacterium]